ncbi:hypothetical protein SY83_08375 [Paenibacillus swuensis]|uniref:Uncharacterized protein n=2 Tax=Paenibacillus swuensis TaxID=1178515 RepID=A0A172THE4_9BACL|nr:hypothetical protein SY83_08375 [Paenibacillus swuensis]
MILSNKAGWMMDPNTELAKEILNRPSGQSRILYVSQLMKGRDAARMIQDFKAQETIRAMTQRILDETMVGE